LWLARNVPVLVYQMAKVGSMSVYRSLLAQEYAPLVHLHRLQRLRQRHPWRYWYVKSLFASRKRIRLISPVREPVSRNLSSFAEDFASCFGGSMQDHSLQELETLFWRYDRHDWGINWFDEELNRSTGIDVYAYPFDQEAGYGTLSEGRFEVLLLKAEIPDDIKETAIREFLHLPQFHLESYNLAQERAYKGNYRQFVASVHLPETYLTELYSSKFSHQFYSAAERSRLLQTWRGARR